MSRPHTGFSLGDRLKISWIHSSLVPASFSLKRLFVSEVVDETRFSEGPVSSDCDVKMLK